MEGFLRAAHSYLGGCHLARGHERRSFPTDALGNAYYSRPHPRIAGKEIREVLPAAGGSDPQSYDPSALPIEWAAWLNGREIAPMQAAVAAHEQVQARQEARRQAADLRRWAQRYRAGEHYGEPGDHIMLRTIVCELSSACSLALISRA